ncbi:response regulator [Thiohalobacter thiocyanaticus]|uniref:Response regulator n=1 Tax=Thiohalobacter thiocyanaticus TaxID=585455 RepID=A0A426QJA9_9GAMM|nr:response regulator [Thiohalobacter thiocyanaticus]RRQ21787.1 response regulator [Thiohalobacter thiocyanaticus]
MPTPVLICDDSSFARKQMARALPPGWDVEISFATNGQEALEAIAAGKGDVLFLDLNMPVLDGYETLAEIRHRDLPAMVIVVSGDVQPEARDRVLALGAMDYIRKPIDVDKVEAILNKFGIRFDAAHQTPREIDIAVEALDVHQEIVNIAMGRAADLLARSLGVFVKLPVPQLQLVERNALQQALAQASLSEAVFVVSQGFIGAGIGGEALLSFTESSFAQLAELMHYEGALDASAETELIMDTAGILIGACLNGIAEQLDIDFSQSHPTVLGRHTSWEELLRARQDSNEQILVIELDYAIEDRDIHCDLILFISGESLALLNERIAYLKYA